MNQKLIGFALVALAVVASVAFMTNKGTSEGGQIPYQDVAAVQAGKQIYQAQCVACHGADLQGQANWRTRNANGRLPAPPHNKEGHTWHHSDEMLIGMVTNGIEEYAPAGYQSDMPAYNSILEKQQILSVLAYIKSTWPEEIQQRHNQIPK